MRKSHLFLCAAFLVVSAAFGIGRFFIPGHVLTVPGTYEALVHIWMGILLVFAFNELSWLVKSIKKVTPNPPPITKGIAISSGIVISLIEIFMFIYQGWFEVTFG
ncbi:MAG: hypothetical protein D3908_04160 [Candidatus Electrothrix sp. AUS4]|nr:hypothetical protein [Candidatus Electrothrix sp. AUS4]